MNQKRKKRMRETEAEAVEEPCVDKDVENPKAGAGASSELDAMIYILGAPVRTAAGGL
jgi:hypothetical protein